MKKRCILLWLLLVVSLGLWSDRSEGASPECEGNFVNPITDICRECIFPVTIGNVPVAEDKHQVSRKTSPYILALKDGALRRTG